MSPLTDHPCDFCGSEAATLIMSGPDLLEGLPGHFQFVRCESCGLLRQNPRLDWEELSGYYPPDYVSHASQIAAQTRGLKRFGQRYGHWKRVRLVAKYKPAGRWLDVGCGSGLNLQEAHFWNQWELSGLEPVTAMAEYTSQQLGIPVFNTTIENFSAEAESYDIITLWDVLEHLPNPSEAISKISRLLKPGGILVLSTPNLASLDHRWFKDAWIGYDLPRHLNLFPPALLNELLKKNGLTPIRSVCLAGSHAALLLDFGFLHRKTGSALAGRIAGRGGEFLPYRLLTFLPLWVIDHLKMGTNITVVARKD